MTRRRITPVPPRLHPDASTPYERARDAQRLAFVRRALRPQAPPPKGAKRVRRLRLHPGFSLDRDDGGDLVLSSASGAFPARLGDVFYDLTPDAPDGPAKPESATKQLKAFAARLVAKWRAAIAGRAATASKVAPDDDAAEDAGFQKLKQKLMSRPPALVIGVYLTAFVAVIVTVYAIRSGIVPKSYWGAVDDVKDLKHDIGDQKRQLERYSATLSSALDAVNATKEALGVAGNASLAAYVARARDDVVAAYAPPGATCDGSYAANASAAAAAFALSCVLSALDPALEELGGGASSSTTSGLVSYDTLDAMDDQIDHLEKLWKACDGLIGDMNELGWAAEYAWVVGCWSAFCWTFPCIFYVLRQWDEGVDALQSGDATRSARYAGASISAAPSLLGNVLSAWAWVWLILALLCARRRPATAKKRTRRGRGGNNYRKFRRFPRRREHHVPAAPGLLAHVAVVALQLHHHDDAQVRGPHALPLQEAGDGRGRRRRPERLHPLLRGLARRRQGGERVGRVSSRTKRARVEATSNRPFF